MKDVIDVVPSNLIAVVDYNDLVGPAIPRDGRDGVPAETDPAGAAAPLPGVPFAMAARARRVVAECQPRVRHWRSYARTRHMKTRESERGGAAPKACSQTRRKLAKSKPSKTTFRPSPVSCGITERSLLCSIKSSLMRDFRVRSSLPVARPTADLSQPYAPPVGLSLATRSPGVGSQPCGAKYPRFCADSKGV